MDALALWLAKLQLDEYLEVFIAHRVTDLGVLASLSDEDLASMGIPLGDRRRLQAALAREAHSPAHAERRQITVMFVDLVGSTALSQTLDPEELRRLFRSYQNTVMGEVTRYQGHIAQFLGDGVVSYFGWPQALEDGAERAVRAALAVRDMLSTLRTPQGEAVAVRIGIETGTVVVGALLDGSTSAVGQTPNVAARLQSVAEPGQVVVGEATRQLLGELFELQTLAPQELKGIVGTVVAYQVLGEHDPVSRFDAYGNIRKPLIGRQYELTYLEQRWAQAVGGRDQRVLLEGEAGIGKSHLIATLRSRLELQYHRQVIWQCSPYHEAHPLYPVVRFIWRSIGLLPDSAVAPAEIRHRLANWLESTATEAQDLPVLLGLLGVDRAFAEQGTSDWRRRTLDVVVQWLLRLAVKVPLLLVVEDFHWVDPSTRELLSRLSEAMAGHNILLLVSTRPLPDVVESPCDQRLPLQRLDTREIESLVEQFAGRPLPSRVREEITTRTDGVPLFIEQFTLSLLESDVLRQKGDRYELTRAWQRPQIPAGLHGSLMARLDRLGNLKWVVQTVACIGREFSVDTLAAILHQSTEELSRALATLVEADILSRKEISPYTVYEFRHRMIQEVAYESLLKAERAELHLRIAGVLETRFPMWMESAPEVLAFHFSEVGLTERAVYYWQQAAQRSLERFANHEALLFASKGVDQLMAGGEAGQYAAQELPLQFIRGAAARIVEGFSGETAIWAFRRAIELAHTVGEQSYWVEASRGLWSTLSVQGCLSEALAIGVEVTTHAQDDYQRMLGLYMSGVVKLLQGELILAHEHLDQALALYQADYGNLGLSIQAEPKIYLLLFLGMANAHLGRVTEGMTQIRGAVELAHRQGFPLSEADALVFYCNTLSYYQEPVSIPAKALEQLADQHRMPHHEPLARFRLLTDDSNSGSLSPARRLTELHAALDQYRQVARIGTPALMAQLAVMALHAGALDRAAGALAEAFAVSQETGERYIKAELYRVQGLLNLRWSPHAPENAEAAFRQALALAKAQNSKLFELHAALSLAKFYQQQGMPRQGRATLDEVLVAFAGEPEVGLLARARQLQGDLPNWLGGASDA